MGLFPDAVGRLAGLTGNDYLSTLNINSLAYEKTVLSLNGRPDGVCGRIVQKG
jgi:hypothetical protein